MVQDPQAAWGCLAPGLFLGRQWCSGLLRELSRPGAAFPCVAGRLLSFPLSKTGVAVMEGDRVPGQSTGVTPASSGLQPGRTHGSVAGLGMETPRSSGVFLREEDVWAAETKGSCFLKPRWSPFPGPRPKPLLRPSGTVACCSCPSAPPQAVRPHEGG